MFDPHQSGVRNQNATKFFKNSKTTIQLITKSKGQHFATVFKLDFLKWGSNPHEPFKDNTFFFSIFCMYSIQQLCSIIIIIIITNLKIKHNFFFFEKRLVRVTAAWTLQGSWGFESHFRKPNLNGVINYYTFDFLVNWVTLLKFFLLPFLFQKYHNILTHMNINATVNCTFPPFPRII